MGRHGRTRRSSPSHLRCGRTRPGAAVPGNPPQPWAPAMGSGQPTCRTHRPKDASSGGDAPLTTHHSPLAAPAVARFEGQRPLKGAVPGLGSAASADRLVPRRPLPSHGPILGCARRASCVSADPARDSRAAPTAGLQPTEDLAPRGDRGPWSIVHRPWSGWPFRDGCGGSRGGSRGGWPRRPWRKAMADMWPAI